MKAAPTADIYSLGAVLYECLTGQMPFKAATGLDTLILTLHRECERPRFLNSNLPPDLETICLKALEKEPSRRYTSAAALADDLERWLRGEPIEARPIGSLGRAWRWCRRKPLIAGLATALVLAVISGVFATVFMWRKAVENETRALEGEAQARDSLRLEEESRREVEQQYAMLRMSINNNVLSSSSLLFASAEANPIRLEMLSDTESALSRLLARRPEDSDVRALLASVLTQVGVLQLLQHQGAKAVISFERAIGFWKEMPQGQLHAPNKLAWLAIAYVCLEQAYDSQGKDDRAQECFARAFQIWREIIEKNPDRVYSDNLFPAAVEMRWLVSKSGYSEEEASRRFFTLRERLGKVAAREDADYFWAVLRVAFLCPLAELHNQAGNKSSILPVAREAGDQLSKVASRASLSRSYLIHAAYQALRVSMWLRRAGSHAQAARLIEQINQRLEVLLQGNPKDQLCLVALGESWHEISKIRWDLKQAEESVTAAQKAVECQRKAAALPTAAPGARNLLGWRYTQLGRKLCELGRLDEAEACFVERQALWPGDAEKHQQALAELRKWAAEVEENSGAITQEQKAARDRYLELHRRLEEKGPHGR